MQEKKRSAQRVLVIAIVLMLVSMMGASWIQTSGGKVTVKDIRFETTTGYRMSGLLFVPDGVSAESPAPGIVVSHGMFNNREMQDLNFVELSRRGYVVFSMDMISHGNSDNTNNIGGVVVGMYEAVKMLDSLSYVDSTRIGITGHSLGGMSSNVAVSIDNAMPEQLISAVLLNSADATYTDDNGQYTDVYGSRDVGVIAGQYDEFFFVSVDENGKTTSPRDYVKYSNAQSFLHFGTDPAGRELRQPETVYTQEMDGQNAMRVIYNPEIIHPWSHFSQRSTVATIDFFEQALGAPAPLAASNQVWQYKELFNLVGLVGIALFIVSFATLMVYTPMFAVLRAEAPVAPMTLAGRDKVWFWGSLGAGALFGALAYFPIMLPSNSFTTARTMLPQSPPWGVGLWSLACGAFAVLCMVVSYRVNGKRNGFNAAQRGVTLTREKLCKTILLAVIVVAVSYSWVFVADYFFKTDFRLWVVAMRAFEADKIFVSLVPYAFFFLAFYIANSVAVNCFNDNTLGGRRWVNLTVVALFNALPAVALLLMQYASFKASGYMLLSGDPYNMYTVWLFPFLVYLPVTAILSRCIYRATNNPYLPGIINGLLITIISCSNTLTWSK